MMWLLDAVTILQLCVDQRGRFNVRVSQKQLHVPHCLEGLPAD
jgi:hypothetical protein